MDAQTAALRPEDDDGVIMSPRDALVQMLEGPGWQLFQAMVRQEWGAGAVLKKMEDAIHETPRSDQAAVHESLIAQRQAVLAMMARPQLEVDVLSSVPVVAQPDPFAAHRRVRS